MSCYQINGGTPLRGRLAVQGAKNSVLPILAAALLAPGESVIHNCPDLSDVTATLDILRLLGCGVSREGDTVALDARELDGTVIPASLMGELRSSVIFLGALLTRMGEVELSYPGGCELGPRPIDLHLGALRQLGAEIREEGGFLHCRADRLRGREVVLRMPSVGATENLMLAACGAEGVTVISNADREPEVVDLQNFLNACGARVEGAGTPVISIEGGLPLHPAEHTVIGDRIAAATYLCAVGAAGGEIVTTGVDPDHLTAVLCALQEAGCRVETGAGEIRLTCYSPLRAIRPVRTAPHPGFPTDAQAILMAALAGGTGSTMFVENIFSSRYHHVDELSRMGADIQVAGRVAVVNGRRLHGARVRGCDLRGGAALVVAALGAEGTSRISGLKYIRRGYDGLDTALRALGAEITTIL